MGTDVNTKWGFGMKDGIALLDSITDATAESVGKIGISGSHGGLYAAAYASRAGLRAVVLNDAGVGKDRAGIAGLIMLDEVGAAGVSVSTHSARIGSARDTFETGVVGYGNETARALGLQPGRPLRDQIDLLRDAPEPTGRLAPKPETRRMIRVGQTDVLCVDSASLIVPEDAGAIIVTGSHGGLIGGDPARACKADAKLVVFNDAGGGKDNVGTSRLPALNLRGVAAVALSHDSCRIGDARSGLETGVVSAANEIAYSFGFRPDTSLMAFLMRY